MEFRFLQEQIEFRFLQEQIELGDLPPIGIAKKSKDSGRNDYEA